MLQIISVYLCHICLWNIYYMKSDLTLHYFLAHVKENKSTIWEFWLGFIDCFEKHNTTNELWHVYHIYQYKTQEKFTQEITVASTIINIWIYLMLWEICSWIKWDYWKNVWCLWFFIHLYSINWLLIKQRDLIDDDRLIAFASSF